MRSAVLLNDVLFMRYALVTRNILFICTGKGSCSQGRQQRSTCHRTEKQACVTPQPCGHIHHGQGHYKQETGS